MKQRYSFVNAAIKAATIFAVIEFRMAPPANCNPSSNRDSPCSFIRCAVKDVGWSTVGCALSPSATDGYHTRHCVRAPLPFFSITIRLYGMFRGCSWIHDPRGRTREGKKILGTINSFGNLSLQSGVTLRLLLPNHSRIKSRNHVRQN